MRLTTALIFVAVTPAIAWSQSLTETSTLHPSDGVGGDAFAHSVAISGDLAIVGAWRDDDHGQSSGSAYIFNATTGEQLFKLVPNDGEAGDWFGASVAIAGNTAVVGAYLDNDNGIASGSAYIFTATTGEQIAKLLPIGGAGGDQFGRALAISGNTVIVGSAEGNTGTAYLFSASTGRFLTKLHSNDISPGDVFGASVAISETTAIVGAPGDQDKGTDSGSAYLFDTATGIQISKLLPSDGSPADAFGKSVGISGNTVVVGAPLDDDNGSGSGSAYLFNVTTSQQIAKLLSSDGESNDDFGRQVSISGNAVLVGANGNDANGTTSGSAYIFDASTGLQVSKLVASDGVSSGRFADSVAISGNISVIGDETQFNLGCAYLYDSTLPGSQDNTGAAYCFGDGSGASCPCGASANAGEGCLNSNGAVGASLEASGNALISSDTFQLAVQGVPGSKPGLILRGKSQHAGGLGAPVGDGLLCTSEQTARSHVQVTSLAGTTTFTHFDGSPFGVANYGAGLPTHYQFWYRDPLNTCSGSGFNFSNAWTVTWLP